MYIRQILSVNHIRKDLRSMYGLFLKVIVIIILIVNYFKITSG